MVIIWNDLACGDREAAAVLVAINSVFQVIMFAVLGWFYLSVLPGWLGLEQTTIDTSPWQIAKSVLIFLGIPLLAGFLSRFFGERAKGRDWYDNKFIPKISPWALYGLLFTIVVLFSMQGEQITSQPWDVVRIALPLLAYFALMWGGGYILGAAIGLGYERTTTPGVHRRGQQLRTRDRGSHRHLRRHLGASSCRCRRPADRGTGARRAGLCLPCSTQTLCSRRGFIQSRKSEVMSKPSVLFVCVHNAGRSQMAAGFLSHLAGDAIEVRSAGSAPAETVNSAAVEAMAERGIDISAQSPKILTVDAVQDSDVVITMGCGDTCPIFPGKSYRDWVLDDPAGQGLEAVRPIRDEIERRVQALIAELTTAAKSS